MMNDLEEKVSNINNTSLLRPQNKPKMMGGTQVCRYWLEHRCRNGDNCPYIHEIIYEKIPDCPYGESCTKAPGECPFKHPRRIVKDCLFYNCGYCKEGKECKHSHKKKEVCINYLLGFCPDGPKCKFVHLKTLIQPCQDNMNFLAKKTG